MGTTDLPNLEQIESRAYQSLWRDGLVDLVTGTALILIGYFWVFQDAVYGSFVAPLLVPVWYAARKKLSEPRMGVVKFGAERVEKEHRRLVILFVFGVIALLVGIAWYFFVRNSELVTTPGDANLVAGLPALLLAIPAVFLAFAQGQGRFFVYGAILLVTGVIVALVDLHPGWGFLPAGFACAGVGGILLWRFLHENPLDEELH